MLLTAPMLTNRHGVFADRAQAYRAWHDVSEDEAAALLEATKSRTRGAL